MKIITIANQKGGAGKTSTAAALWFYLNAHGKKALAIDMDAQCNLTFTAGATAGGGTILGVLSGEIEPAAAIQHTPNGDIIPATLLLNGADVTLNLLGREYLLRKALDKITGYDFVIIDTPPHLGVLTVNALQVATNVIIPTQADIFSAHGIVQLYSNIETIRRGYNNPTLKVDGILLTRFSDRTILSRDIQESLLETAEQMGTRVYKATIREAVAVKEAQVKKQSIFDAAPGSNIAKDYTEFINEFLEGLDNGKE